MHARSTHDRTRLLQLSYVVVRAARHARDRRVRRRRERTVVRVRRRGVESQLRRDVVDDRDPHRRRVLRAGGGDVGVVVVAVENLGRGLPGGPGRGDARRDEGEGEQQGRRDEQARQEHGLEGGRGGV